MGHARRLANGEFAAVYNVLDPKPGQAAQKTVPGGERFSTAKAAEVRAGEYELALRREADGLGILLPQRRHVPTLAAYGSDVIANMTGIADSTRDKYRSALEGMVREFFGDTRIDGLTLARVERYHRSIVASTAHSPSTCEARLVVLRKIVKRAIREEVADIPDPAKWDVRIRLNERPYRHLPSESELQQLIQAAPQTVRVAILLAHDCGMRVGEVAGLKTQGVDWRHGHLRVMDVVDLKGVEGPAPKGGRRRSIPMSARVTAALREHFARTEPDGRVFWNSNTGHPMRIQNLQYQIRRARDKAGLSWKINDIWESVQWHDLRRCFATRMYRTNSDIEKLRRLMGHASVLETQKYIFDLEDEDDNRDTISRAFDSPAGLDLAS